MWDLGFRVRGLGFRVWDLGFRGRGLGFRVWGVACDLWLPADAECFQKLRVPVKEDIGGYIGIYRVWGFQKFEVLSFKDHSILWLAL